jgi:hypothetical protein
MLEEHGMAKNGNEPEPMSRVKVEVTPNQDLLYVEALSAAKRRLYDGSFSGATALKLLGILCGKLAVAFPKGDPVELRVDQATFTILPDQ